MHEIEDAFYVYMQQSEVQKGKIVFVEFLLCFSYSSILFKENTFSKNTT